MRTAPKSPRLVTRTLRIGCASAAACAQMPSASSACTLRRDSAKLRSSHAGALARGGCASMSATDQPSGASAQARLEPTSPPPTMAMSNRSVMSRF